MRNIYKRPSLVRALNFQIERKPYPGESFYLPVILRASRDPLPFACRAPLTDLARIRARFSNFPRRPIGPEKSRRHALIRFPIYLSPGNETAG